MNRLSINTESINTESLRGGVFFLTRRLSSSIVTVFALAVIVFVMVKAIPGDEAHVAAGESATPAQVAVQRQRLGLDHSLPVQLWTFLGHLVHGDLGTSISSRRSVAAGLLQVLPQTLELVVLATVLMIAVTFPAAILSALGRESGRDLAVRLAVILATALPTFWVALELQNLLGAELGLLPISGRLSRGFTVPSRTGSILLDSLLAGNPLAFWNAFQHLVLPAAILMLPFAGQLFRALRAELVTVLHRDHITVAIAKGLPTRLLVRRHVLPNAMGPALTVIGIEFGNMVAAAVLVEAVFGLDGIGSYLTTAVAQKDTFAVLGGVLLIGVVVIATNFVVDVVQLVRDPRTRSAQLGAS